MALAVLVACGLVWFAVPRQAKPAGPLSNWALATALPTSEDFPAGWQYSLRGSLTPPTIVTHPLEKNPDETFEPAECAYSPMDEIGKDEVASVEAYPPGEGGQHGHKVHYWIWAVADGPGLVSQYMDWLGRCHTYRYSYRNPETGATVQDTVVTTKVDIPVPEGVDAAAADAYGSDTSAGPTHFSYAVRGVLLECDFGVRGEDLALAQRLADQTVRKLLAL